MLGVGVGGMLQEFEALGVPFAARGQLTDDYLAAMKEAWGTQFSIPIWVGGNSAAAVRRSVKFGAAWHPIRVTAPFLRDALARHTLPAVAPRISLRLTTAPADDPAGSPGPAASSRSSAIFVR